MAGQTDFREIEVEGLGVLGREASLHEVVDAPEEIGDIGAEVCLCEVVNACRVVRGWWWSNGRMLA
jgi:hypothetical protein